MSLFLLLRACRRFLLISSCACARPWCHAPLSEKLVPARAAEPLFPRLPPLHALIPHLVPHLPPRTKHSQEWDRAESPFFTGVGQIPTLYPPEWNTRSFYSSAAVEGSRPSPSSPPSQWDQSPTLRVQQRASFRCPAFGSRAERPSARQMLLPGECARQGPHCAANLCCLVATSTFFSITCDVRAALLGRQRREDEKTRRREDEKTRRRGDEEKTRMRTRRTSTRIRTRKLKRTRSRTQTKRKEWKRKMKRTRTRTRSRTKNNVKPRVGGMRKSNGRRGWSRGVRQEASLPRDAPRDCRVVAPLDPQYSDMGAARHGLIVAQTFSNTRHVVQVRALVDLRRDRYRLSLGAYLVGRMLRVEQLAMEGPCSLAFTPTFRRSHMRGSLCLLLRLRSRPGSNERSGRCKREVRPRDLCQAGRRFRSRLRAGFARLALHVKHLATHTHAWPYSNPEDPQSKWTIRHLCRSVDLTSYQFLLVCLLVYGLINLSIDPLFDSSFLQAYVYLLV